jgi:hypothetical protein
LRFITAPQEWNSSLDRTWHDWAAKPLPESRAVPSAKKTRE